MSKLHCQALFMPLGPKSTPKVRRRKFELRGKMLTLRKIEISNRPEEFAFFSVVRSFLLYFEGGLAFPSHKHSWTVKLAYMSWVKSQPRSEVQVSWLLPACKLPTIYETYQRTCIYCEQKILQHWYLKTHVRHCPTLPYCIVRTAIPIAVPYPHCHYMT